MSTPTISQNTKPDPATYTAGNSRNPVKIGATDAAPATSIYAPRCRLERNPPRVIIWTSKPFDRSRLRGLEWTAPHLRAWIQSHYQKRGRDDGIWVLMVPLAEIDRTRRFNRSSR